MNSQNNNPKSIPPFSCKYTPQFPQLLQHLNCSIAISTYQAGKVIFISAKDKETLIQLPRNFDKAMGIAENTKKDKLAIACKDEIIVFRNSSELAESYPNAPNKYDSLYVPRNTLHTGEIDIHDLSYGINEEIYAVNTLFSTIVKVDENYNFIPYWKPPFIDKISAEDRCHLNGMAMKNGKPKYITAFNNGNKPRSWKENITESGIIMDVEKNKIILNNLPMPHTPRIINNELYLLLSATGELIKICTNTGTYEVIIQINGFVRGMSQCEDYLFIGLSKLRKQSSTFGKIPYLHNADESGIVALHLPSKKIIGKVTYLSSVEEIYDIHILENKIRPNILNTLSNEYKNGIMTPKTTYWKKNSET